MHTMLAAALVTACMALLHIVVYAIKPVERKSRDTSKHRTRSKNCLSSAAAPVVSSLISCMCVAQI